ncbi:RIP metalloprotease RseP, partial [Aureispira]|nr:RIP metalloprotease RseP [Aureispira sp.]
GWLPLGGYVKIAGMIDESMDKEAMAKPPQPWEFRSKPAWQRLIVMLGGVTVNILLGFFIFAMLLWTYGEKFLPSKNVKYGIYCSELAKEMGFMDGDQILSIGDEKFEKFNPGVLVSKMLFDEVYNIRLLRDGIEKTIIVPDSSIIKIPSKGEGPLMTPRVPFVVGAFSSNSPAKEAGIEIGDSLIACNGISSPFFSDFKNIVSEHKNVDVTIDFYRNNELKKLTIRTSEKGLIGVGPYGPDRYFEFDRDKFGFIASFPAGCAKGYNFLATQIKAFGQMFTGRIKASESLGGFISIGKLFPPEWDWEHFWRMTAILSLILGFMNLLPIPALDGGHVMFLMFEIVARRPVSEKVLEFAQVVGIVLLLSLLLYANGMDIYRLFF